MLLFQPNRDIFHNLNAPAESLGVEMVETPKSPVERIAGLESIFQSRQNASQKHFERCKTDSLYVEAQPTLDEALQTIAALNRECEAGKTDFSSSWQQESSQLYAELNTLDEFGVMEDASEQSEISPSILEARREFAKDLLQGFAEVGAGFNSITNAAMAVYHAKTQEEAVNAWNYLEVGLAIIPLPIAGSLRWVRQGSKWIQKEAVVAKEAVPLTRTAGETAEITSREVVNLSGRDAEFVLAYVKSNQSELVTDVAKEVVEKQAIIAQRISEYVERNGAEMSKDALMKVDDYFVDIWRLAQKNHIRGVIENMINFRTKLHKFLN